MRKNTSNSNTRLATPRALAIAVVAGVLAVACAGCAVTSSPMHTPQLQSTLSDNLPTVTPIQPGFSSWNDANWGDSGL